MILELSLIGILVSCFYILLFNVYPGGIIVPVFFSFYLTQPFRLLATIMVSLISVVIFQFLSQKLIIFGRRRFVFLIILSAFLSLLTNFFFQDYQSGLTVYGTIGMLIPGLLANNIIRQGFFVTIASMFTVSIITYFLFKVFFYL